MPNLKDVISPVARYTLLGFTLTIIAGIIVHLLSYVFRIQAGANAVNSLDLLKGSTWLLIATYAILEEWTFRGFLSAGKIGITVSITGLLYAAGSHVIDHYSNLTLHQSLLSKISISIGVAVVLLAVIYFIVSVNFESIKKFILKYYKWMFWVSCAAFACAHILNYKDHDSAWPAYLLLVFPQFIMGAILAYVRVKFGIFQSIAVHIFLDFLLLTMMMIRVIHHQPIVLLISITAISGFFIGLFFMFAEAAKIGYPDSGVDTTCLTAWPSLE